MVVKFRVVWRWCIISVGYPDYII